MSCRALGKWLCLFPYLKKKNNKIKRCCRLSVQESHGSLFQESQMIARRLDLRSLPSFQDDHQGLLPSSSTPTLRTLRTREGGLSSQGEASSMMPRLLRPHSGLVSIKPAGGWSSSTFHRAMPSLQLKQMGIFELLVYIQK